MLSEFGEPTDTWSELDEVWAAIEPAMSTERREGDSRQEVATHTVLIRYLTGVDAKDRVVFGSRHLYIVGVANMDERDDHLVLTCRERMA